MFFKNKGATAKEEVDFEIGSWGIEVPLQVASATNGGWRNLMQSYLFLCFWWEKYNLKKNLPEEDWRYEETIFLNHDIYDITDISEST